MLRKRLHSICLAVTLQCVMVTGLFAQNKLVVVDQSGGGDFTSIQEALNSLPDAAKEQRIIYIRNGVYREKIFVEKDFVSLVGEDKNRTQLVVSQARDIWRCENRDDWGVATINLKGSDIVLENLTITNQFGFDMLSKAEPMHIDCRLDSINPFKTVTATGHQMALRSFATTRMIVRNCILRAYGGDTVSPWNVESGMFYFKDCLMEGGVDFYCPRGWAYAEDCEFVAHGNVAAIWHDGSLVKESKTVLNRCLFRGDDGFKLGRYHRDAQFYILNSVFADNMADAPVYLNPSNPQNTIQWGHRVYYYNNHRKAGDYPWFADNISQAEGSPDPAAINAAWTFSGRWNPSAIPTVIPAVAVVRKTTTAPAMQQPVDSVAENMLVYQRAIGGWPKAVNEIKVDYTRQMTAGEIKATRNDSLRKDATIDNNATTREIRYLVKAYRQTGNRRYLAAAEKGIRYLLMAQNAAGGWPQYYPDSSLYRAQITFNDNAMMNVMEVLEDIMNGKKEMAGVNPAFEPLCRKAIERGIECILNTQIRANGTLTAWCAQYNPRTLQPEMARKFEPPSTSAAESVNIIRFLMRVPEPSERIVASVKASVAWLDKVKIKGYKYADVPAPELPKKTDRVLLPEAGSIVWARFYEIGTDRPLFAGRDSQIHYDVSEIEYERRTGYAWYGTWPEKLLRTEFPAWQAKHSDRKD